MGRLILYKVASILGLFFVITIVTFFLMQLSPTDPVSAKFYLQGMTPDPVVVERIRQELGLNDPWYMQYGRWLIHMLHGDFGQSIFYDVPVETLLADAIPKTLGLVMGAFIIGSTLAILLGVLSAKYEGTWVDYGVRIISFIALAIPSFWVGLLLLYAFAVKIPIFSVTNTKGLSAYVLPCITLGIWFAGLYIRRVRNATLEVLKSLPVMGARTMGVKEKYIYTQYVLPKVRLVLLSMVGISLGSMLGGSAVIETVFALKGMGFLMVTGIISRDYIVIQSYIVWAAMIYVVMNRFVDVWSYYYNPLRRWGDHR